MCCRPSDGCDSCSRTARRIGRLCSLQQSPDFLLCIYFTDIETHGSQIVWQLYQTKTDETKPYIIYNQFHRVGLNIVQYKIVDLKYPNVKLLGSFKHELSLNVAIQNSHLLHEVLPWRQTNLQSEIKGQLHLPQYWCCLFQFYFRWITPIDLCFQQRILQSNNLMQILEAWHSTFRQSRTLQPQNITRSSV